MIPTATKPLTAQERVRFALESGLTVIGAADMQHLAAIAGEQHGLLVPAKAILGSEFGPGQYSAAQAQAMLDLADGKAPKAEAAPAPSPLPPANAPAPQPVAPAAPPPADIPVANLTMAKRYKDALLKAGLDSKQKILAHLASGRRLSVFDGITPQSEAIICRAAGIDVPADKVVEEEIGTENPEPDLKDMEPEA